MQYKYKLIYFINLIFIDLFYLLVAFYFFPLVVETFLLIL
jgi:hypothetical protein